MTDLTCNPAATDAATPTATPLATPATPAAFAALGLAQPLLKAVADLGFTQPTLVQQAVIPKAMQAEGSARPGGHAFTDLMVSSQTGSGKTAAFLLPVLHTLLAQMEQQEAAERAAWERLQAEAAAAGQPAPKRAKRQNPLLARHFKPTIPGALVLCPTRELAQQVANDAIDLVQHCRGLRIANVVGGMPYQMQIAKLQNANLVVATPGRLLDLQRSGQLVLDQVQFLVVDEADRMLDLGFADDLAEVNRLTAARRQTMMFSATFAPRIQALATRVMREPQRVQIDTPQDRHVNIEQRLYWCDSPEHKRQLLDHWLRDASIEQAIVFSSTQIECDALAADLQQAGFAAVALHGALSQGLRNRRLMALRSGQVQILVATDVAARGIDVPSITHVFNFGLPMKAEDYTHRIGRTGRAGRQGLAVTMAEMRDRRKIGEIEAYSQQVIDTHTVPGMEPRKPLYESRDPRRGAGGRPPAGRGARPGPYGGPREGGFGARPTQHQPHHPPRAPGEGPRHGFGKPAPARQGHGDRPAYGDRPAFAERPSYGDRPAWGDKRERPQGGAKPFAGKGRPSR
ncbi:MAG: DEAD/DEAH box helicase [Pseudomonadota bacterium]